MVSRTQTERKFMTIPIKVVRLPHAEGLPLPSYATAGAAGMDLYAAINDEYHISPDDRVLIPTGLKIAIPKGYELQIRPRSGLVFNDSVTVANSPGTIDEDYRGEVMVMLTNFSAAWFVVKRGMRIAQAVLAPVVRATWHEVTSLDETERGEGGFGSTGV
jgi:dUTP pyrophosphatase